MVAINHDKIFIFIFLPSCVQLQDPFALPVCVAHLPRRALVAASVALLRGLQVSLRRGLRKPYCMNKRIESPHFR
jgi:hypothetical protein